jgi:uncharacterized protein YndB with AHSA1/START domain
MQNVLDFPDLTTPARDERSQQTLEKNWTIDLAVAVNADTRRIFQALTVPEYLEAWIDMPDRAEGSRVVASMETNGYRLDHYSAGYASVHITGSYLFCHQRKLRMFWRKICPHSSTESLVDFRLRGNFGSSILELRHSALESAEEFYWHRRLWQGSLGKLALLLRSA